MKKINFLLICILCINSSCFHSTEKEQQQTIQDSLLNNAKWELYKHNIGRTQSKKKYVSCNNNLMPFIGYDIGTPKVTISSDTVRYFFYMEQPNCRNQLAKGPEVGVVFIREDSSYWIPFDGVVYISKKLQKIYSDDIAFEPFVTNDSLFSQYIDLNRTVTNHWLLDYYDNVIKKRLVKK